MVLRPASQTIPPSPPFAIFAESLPRALNSARGRNCWENHPRAAKRKPFTPRPKWRKTRSLLLASWWNRHAESIKSRRKNDGAMPTQSAE